MATLQALPENARFYIEKNFYNDVNGNPRIYFEIYDENMNFLGFCQDNYAGTNFCYGRDIKRVSYQKASGIRQYKQSLKGCIEFENKSAKKF